MTRAFFVLLGAVAAGALIWVAAQVNEATTGGYWGQMAIIGAAGLVLAFARLVPVRRGRRLLPSVPTLVLSVVPTAVAAAWVLVAAEPHGNTFRSHVLTWSSDIHIAGVVRDLSPFAAVLALGVGVVLALTSVEQRVVQTVTAPFATDAVAPVPARDEAPTVISDPDPIPH